MRKTTSYHQKDWPTPGCCAVVRMAVITPPFVASVVLEIFGAAKVIVGLLLLSARGAPAFRNAVWIEVLSGMMFPTVVIVSVAAEQMSENRRVL